MIRAAVACIGLAFATVATAAEYGSVGTAGAVLYDGPSTEARKIFAAPPGMPVELLSLINRWVKVRDHTGESFWIEREALSPRRMLVATRIATVREAARDDAPVVFRVLDGVLLELLEPAPAPGWARVRHVDGTSGYVRADEVWGL